MDLKAVLADPNNVAVNLRSYISGFSPEAREVIRRFGFDEQITRLDRAKLLYLVLSKFADLDLLPQTVPNTTMGYIYEELIRRQDQGRVRDPVDPALLPLHAAQTARRDRCRDQGPGSRDPGAARRRYGMILRAP